MDGGSGLSDAEMRFITVNGQTIMLEGDFENISMTNEFLNEMLMVGYPKVNIEDGCNIEVADNSCINCEKETEEEEPTKLEIRIQSDSNELETVQIGLEEAKALGLYFYECKSDQDAGTWNCSYNGIGQEDEKINGEEKVNGCSGSESCKVKLHSVPIINVGSTERESETLLFVNELSKCDDMSGGLSQDSLSHTPRKMSKAGKQLQEDNINGIPAIGHLEGFHIPTTEEGLLLPTTVNAKMVDGSYQTITLVPQVVNGAITYTVHFSHLSREVIEKNVSASLINDNQIEKVSNCVNSVNKEIINCGINSVEDFLSSVQLIKMNNQSKKNVQNNAQKSNDQAGVGGFTNSLTNHSILKLNEINSSVESGSDVPPNHMHQNQLPIDAKIDNLISENENVISSCKRVKYGKKVKFNDSELVGSGVIKVAKNSATKAKKVKFKSRGIKFLSGELEKKKISLLKPSNELKSESLSKGRGQEKVKTASPCIMPHMNLNGRLEYPNLKAIDETASSLSYLKIKNPQVTKQPYFNVLPYPKDKTIPVQKLILPLNCDLQQAKNLINLQKFLETQKLQLKIQPILQNGNKIVNIRPKPATNDDTKALLTDMNLKQVVNQLQDKHLTGEAVKDDGGIACSTMHGSTNGNSKIREDEAAKKVYQESASINSVLLNGRKLNNIKFLKSEHSNCDGVQTDAKDTTSECGNKLNEKIFIKNNPEYFSQKSKDKKSEEHPLGSSENPIQLVQTGHTFHSRQPLSETQLRQIASVLQKQKFDSPNVKKNSIFDPKTNTRIVYRVVYPEDVELKESDKNSTEGVNKRKRGRHKIKTSATEDEVQKKPSPLPRGPGRPKKSTVSPLEEDMLEEEVEDTTPKKKIPRTRSGRLSRPPRYMVKDYKRLNNSDTSDKATDSNYDAEYIYGAYQNGKEIEGIDNVENIALDSNLLPGLRPQPRSKRNFKPEYRCPTCQKIYLGHTRMMWHLNKFPDHCNVEKYEENYYRKRTETKVRRAARRLNMCDVTNKVKQVLNTMSKDELTSFCGPLLADALTTWDFLLLRVNLLKNSRKDEVDALIQELILLLEKLTKIAEDIFLPVFSKESEKDEDCVQIDRMEVAIALGLPVGFYKVNNDNLNLLRMPSVKCENVKEVNRTEKSDFCKMDSDQLKYIESAKGSPKLFDDREQGPEPWEGGKVGKKIEESSFWLENKIEDSTPWHSPENAVKPLSTKFEPNLSSKLLESSSDSMDDGKYEEPVHLMDLDSNSKDVDQSNSSGNMDGSPELPVERKASGKMSVEVVGEISRQIEPEKSSMWNENTTDKVAEELWNENSAREKWESSSGVVETKSSTELWRNENAEMRSTVEKPAPHLWTESSNLIGSEKVDETNSEFLDSFLSVPNSNGFLSGEAGSFLSENIGLMNDKSSDMKSPKKGQGPKEKNKWGDEEGDGNGYMRVWETEKNPPWSKNETILTSGIQERTPGVRTTSRLTSTPETNGTIPYSISNRRNSISDFSNIGLESTNLDMVLPSAKTLMKDCLKTSEAKFEMKEQSYLERPDNYKVKNWEGEAVKSDFSPGNVNSEDLMKMALESLTSQHDVINVQSSTFDSTIGILNQNQETANLNLFTASETDSMDFNLPLPDHLLRANFATANFTASCEQHSATGDPPSAFLSTTSNIFGPTCTLSNSIKFDQFETSFSDKKSKSLDDVMEFFDPKTSFNGFEGGAGDPSGFPFVGDPNSGDGYQVEGSEPLQCAVAGGQSKKKKPRAQRTVPKRGPKTNKKAKMVKKSVDYPKSSNTIESIINEALFDSCPPSSKPLQDSSPNAEAVSVSAMSTTNDNYALPIISGALDEVENLDFLSQD
ncbi:hypothetical protein RUM44_014017 [Polyplax serrata]|uniref:DUF4764 domain-containing protein n=1 Tax=Polyplax serrata TaxID=468196 RepID=A0ABR1BJP1_POLSC